MLLCECCFCIVEYWCCGIGCGDIVVVFGCEVGVDVDELWLMFDDVCISYFVVGCCCDLDCFVQCEMCVWVVVEFDENLFVYGLFF